MVNFVEILRVEFGPPISNMKTSINIDVYFCSLNSQVGGRYRQTSSFHHAGLGVSLRKHLTFLSYEYLQVIASVVSVVSSVPLASQDDIVGRKVTGYYDRRSAQYDDYDPEDQVAAEASDATEEVIQPHRVPANALARILAAAGAGSTPISSGVSYGKREAEESEIEEGKEDEDAHLQETGVTSEHIARILRIAMAKPQPVVPGDISYLGRRSAMEHQQEEITEDRSFTGYGKRSAQQSQDVVLESDHDTASEVLPVDDTPSAAIHSRVGKSAIAAILAAAGARAAPISAGVSYGKRSAQSENDNTEDVIETEEAQGFDFKSFLAADQPEVPAGVEIPKPRNRVGSYGKRSAEDDAEIVEGLVDAVPLSAVKIKPHSSQGNIHQQFNGNTAYQTSVHSSRFGRVRREDPLKDFIPFHVYDDRRVKTLKVEQNDFLALKGKSASREKESEQHAKSAQ